MRDFLKKRDGVLKNNSERVFWSPLVCAHNAHVPTHMQVPVHKWNPYAYIHMSGGGWRRKRREKLRAEYVS